MRFPLRTVSLAAGLLGTALGIAIADPPAATKDAASKISKSDHLSVPQLRMRIVAEFHGQASSLFTDIPGFGMERMMPMYERIPWEIPHFSTNDVEVEKAPTIPAVLKNVFAKSLESFEKSTGAKATSPPVAAKTQPGFGPTMRGTVVGGMQLRLLDLVGNLDPARPKVFSGGKAFDVVRAKRGAALIGNRFQIGQDQSTQLADPKEAKDAKNHVGSELEQRPLDMFETAGLAELSDGKQTFIREKGNVIRMMGALRASDQCLQCHTEKRKGDLLGALSYTFLDTNRSQLDGNGLPQP